MKFSLQGSPEWFNLVSPEQCFYPFAPWIQPVLSQEEVAPSQFTSAEAPWCPCWAPFGSSPMPSLKAHTASQHILPCCHILNSGQFPFRQLSLSGAARCCWAASQAAAGHEKSLCQSKCHTALGLDPRVFCNITIVGLQKFSEKIEDELKWKVVQISHLALYFYLTHLVVFTRWLQCFHSPCGKCHDLISKIMIQGKGAPLQRLLLPCKRHLSVPWQQAKWQSDSCSHCSGLTLSTTDWMHPHWLANGPAHPLGSQWWSEHIHLFHVPFILKNAWELSEKSENCHSPLKWCFWHVPRDSVVIDKIMDSVCHRFITLDILQKYIWKIL